MQDASRHILYLDERTLVMMNRYPYNNGHLLAAPVRHVASLDRLSGEEMQHLLQTVNLAIQVLKKDMTPDGFNVGLNLGKVAGAGVEDHLHFHIVPRWNGDHNYMTVLGDVRVIPEHIEETYGRLLSGFASLQHRR